MGIDLPSILLPNLAHLRQLERDKLALKDNALSLNGILPTSSFLQLKGSTTTKADSFHSII
jgi:hypothetical protein